MKGAGGQSPVRLAARVLAVGLVWYLILPAVVFDFSAVAVPSDEESLGGKPVAIGPRPRWWVPRAASGLDIPGGFDYEPGGWPFMV